MIEGIDVAGLNGRQAWQSHLGTGFRFAFCKATEGLRFDDPLYGENIKAIRDSGMVRGSYHFAHTSQDWKGEADHYLDFANPTAGHVIALDLEDDNDDTSFEHKNDWKNKWLAYVKGKRPTCRVGLYCNLTYWRKLDDNVGDFLWIAHYNKEVVEPDCSYPWVFWQYGDRHNGADLDVNRTSFKEFKALQNWANCNK